MPSSKPDGPSASRPRWLQRVEEIERPDELDAFLASREDLHALEAIELLTAEIKRLARQSPRRARRLGAAASNLADRVDLDRGYALAARARGHLAYLSGNTEAALAAYRVCQEKFLAAGADLEVAANLGSSMSMLALLGRYDEAWADSRRARRILDRHDDPLALARLLTNEASVFLRQDRHAEALALHRRALALFRERGEVQDIAVSLHNIAVSSIALSDFSSALESYRELGVYCREHSISLLGAQADYNIAYLYFYRGEYSRALEIYQRTRTRCDQLGDSYHVALCDLDQAEIYLELKMTDDAARLARRAQEAFDRRNNGYEAGKALTFLALAAGQRGEHQQALQGFSRARERFASEGNRAWQAMTDYYSALTHYQLLDSSRALERAVEARDFFEGVPWPSRTRSFSPRVRERSNGR